MDTAAAARAWVEAWERAWPKGDVDTVAPVYADDAVREWFTIPENRVVHVPHPSYRGAYQDTVSREQARWELGIDTDETVYALLGAIKPVRARLPSLPWARALRR